LTDYWTLGDHDIVAVIEAPDDETATAAVLALGSQGNVRTKTMRAFSPDEMRAIIEKTSGALLPSGRPRALGQRPCNAPTASRASERSR
jgi:hypothetical protein